MARMAVLVPHQNMLDAAEQMFDEYPYIQRFTVECLQNEQAVGRAKELEAEGCDVIMARGLQAKLIKRAVKLPVVEIRVTAQELGSLVLDLKEEIGLARPKIAAFGFDNMLCDASQFDRLFQVQFKSYRIETDSDSEEDLRAAVVHAAQDGVHGIIGGTVICRQAEELGLSHRFIPSGWESLRSAFDMARHICYAIDREKLNRVEITTMLENTQSGIVRISADGTVLHANTNAYNLLNLPPRELIGAKLTEAFPAMSKELLDKSLLQGEEAYAILVPPSRRETVVNLTPIILEEKITGAILTLQEGHRVMEMSSELRHELYLQGYMARWHFGQFPAKSPEGRYMKEQAEWIAQFSAPVLLTGEAGSGKEILAQCIHNAGTTKGNAFVSLDCRAYPADTLDTLLFGTYSSRKDAPPSLAEAAQNGTLFLDHIDHLSDELQFKVFRLIRGIYMHNGSNRPMHANVRIIAATQGSLIGKVESGGFRSDLFYALNALGIAVKPLRMRREDILDWVEHYLAQWRQRYNRPVRLTQDAKAYLSEYDWPGNLNQVNSVCEQIVLLSPRRNVDEGFLRRQMQQLSPKLLPGSEQVVIYKDERAVKITELLRRYNGNRQKVADALGVSKTTLWRYMKKFGIDKDYSY